MKLAVIGGDGIGPEVTAEALKVLHAVRSDIDTTEYDLGARRYLRNGELLTDADLASLREHDAILLGAIGALAHHHKINVSRIGQRRRSSGIQLGRTEVYVMIQRKSHLEQ